MEAIVGGPKIGGILYDENYQEEIETYFHNILVEYVDMPNNNISKRFSHTCSYKRDKVVGRNVIRNCTILYLTKNK